jgi:hypothetical protein
MFTVSLLCALNLVGLPWTLTAESNGFVLSEYLAATLSGPTVFETPAGPSPNPTVPLIDAVFQDKGEEEWSVPWSEDLSELYFDFDSFPFVWPPAPPVFEFEAFAGDVIKIYAKIKTYNHSQQWHQMPEGTAKRTRIWEEQTGFHVVIEDEE